MEFAQEKGWPELSVTEPVGHDHPGRIHTPLDDFLWLARQFPRLKMILAHAGGLLPFYELNPRLRPELSNVYYDLAACPLLYDASLYRLLIETVGYEKIVWGSDYPLESSRKSRKRLTSLSSSRKYWKRENYRRLKRRRFSGLLFFPS